MRGKEGEIKKKTPMAESQSERWREKEKWR